MSRECQDIAGLYPRCASKTTKTKHAPQSILQLQYKIEDRKIIFFPFQSYICVPIYRFQNHLRPLLSGSRYSYTTIGHGKGKPRISTGKVAHADVGNLESTPSNHEMIEAETFEKAYRINDQGRVLKRSLRPDEYHILDNGERVIPLLVIERLQNEVACMEFIAEHTNIPIPKSVKSFEKDGSYYLWMDFVAGVEMKQLSDEDQAKIFPQIRDIIATLRTLRSEYSGGPTGILSPPSIVYLDHYSTWKQQISPDKNFVFCHGDLSQSNILVDPKTLQIVAIIDWEYSGFFPQDHEIPFYKCSETSGKQILNSNFKPTADRIIEFWRQSQKATR